MIDHCGRPHSVFSFRLSAITPLVRHNHTFDPIRGALYPGPPTTVISRYRAPPRQQQLMTPQMYSAIKYQNAVRYKPLSHVAVLPVNTQMFPTTNQMSRNGPATHIAHSRHGKHAASVKVAASLAPDDATTLNANTDKKNSHAAPLTHNHSDKL